MPFLPPNQQRQSTEGTKIVNKLTQISQIWRFSKHRPTCNCKISTITHKSFLSQAVILAVDYLCRLLRGQNLVFGFTHTRLTALSPGPPRWAGTRKAKPIWILLKQETVSGSGISWNICKYAPRSRQITTPTPHHSVFYRPDALPATQPTASKHWF